MDQWGRPEARDWLSLATSAMQLEGMSQRDKLTQMQMEDYQKKRDLGVKADEYSQLLATGGTIDPKSQGYSANAEAEARTRWAEIDRFKMEEGRRKVATNIGLATAALKNKDITQAGVYLSRAHKDIPDGQVSFGIVKAADYLESLSPGQRASVVQAYPEMAQAASGANGGLVYYGADANGKPVFHPVTEETVKQGIQLGIAYLDPQKYADDYTAIETARREKNAKAAQTPQGLYDADGKLAGRYYYEDLGDGNYRRMYQKAGSDKFEPQEMPNMYDWSVSYHAEELKPMWERLKAQAAISKDTAQAQAALADKFSFFTGEEGEVFSGNKRTGAISRFGGGPGGAAGVAAGGLKGYVTTSTGQAFRHKEAKEFFKNAPSSFLAKASNGDLLMALLGPSGEGMEGLPSEAKKSIIAAAEEVIADPKATAREKSMAQLWLDVGEGLGYFQGPTQAHPLPGDELLGEAHGQGGQQTQGVYGVDPNKFAEELARIKSGKPGAGVVPSQDGAPDQMSASHQQAKGGIARTIGRTLAGPGGPQSASMGLETVAKGLSGVAAMATPAMVESIQGLPESIKKSLLRRVAVEKWTVEQLAAAVKDIQAGYQEQSAINKQGR